MAPDQPEHDINRLWQSQGAQEPSMSLEAIRARARKLDSQIFWRNLREYVGAAVVLAVFPWMAWTATDPIARLGAVLISIATLYVVYQLHAQGTTSPLPADIGETSAVAFHRAQLERERDLLQSVWRWYLLPFAPGMATILLGTLLRRPDRWTTTLAAAIFIVLVTIAIGVLNRRVARQVQRTIDELDRTR
jgi:hypothetical protein